MKLHVFLIFLLLNFRFVFGENYLLNGGQESQIDYQVEQTVIPTAGMRNLTLSFVIPQSFTSPTYNQRISGLEIRFSPQPQSKKEIVDERGNKILRAVWAHPGPSIQSQVTLSAYNQTRLEPVVTSSPFPLPSVPPEALIYLQSTAQVPVNDPIIAAKPVI